MGGRLERAAARRLARIDRRILEREATWFEGDPAWPPADLGDPGFVPPRPHDADDPAYAHHRDHDPTDDHDHINDPTVAYHVNDHGHAGPHRHWADDD